MIIHSHPDHSDCSGCQQEQSALRTRLAEAEELIARFEAQAKRHDAHARNCGFYFHGFFANHAKRRAFLEGSQK